ncbi:MAG: lysylphosphatidylglycerol synthase transmembrane domain-containing protein [Armatimonadota bacterium]|nr:lysylphosphatidylglycerol synthase transmembrane domain-containing protein [Armatimonadota bacterium]
MGSVSERPRNSAKSMVLRIGVSALLMVWLLNKMPLDRLKTAFLNANCVLLALALLTTLVCALVQTMRWAVVLNAMGSTIPFSGLLRSNFVGLFFNLFTPSNVGQDAARVVDFRSSGDSVATGLASVAIDRLLGLLAMLVFALVAFPLASGRLPDSSAVTMAVCVISICLAFVFGLLCSPAGKIVGRFAARFLPAKVDKGLRQFYGMTKQMTAKPGKAFCAVLLALIFQFLVIFANYLIAGAVGVSISLPLLILLVPLTGLVASIPISINGVGLREWAYVQLWGAFGVTSEQAFLSSLAFLATWVAMGLVGAVVYTTRRQALS